MEQSFILDFDPNKHAVLEPDHEQLPYNFPVKLLYAFVPQENIEDFLKHHSYKVLGEFESCSFNPKVYEVKINNKNFALCRAPLGAPAATQLLDWLISYGVKQVIAFGTAGVLEDLPEKNLVLPVRAIRDEGTSFHYMKPGRFVSLESDFLNQIERILTDLKIEYKEITTWTTDAIYRETPKKIAQFRQLGASTVEMECAALAACAQFRKIDFAQMLFSADSLVEFDNYDEREWGANFHDEGFEIGAKILTSLE